MRTIQNSDKKNILIYAHYYVPDTASTGQLLRELAEGLLGYFNVTIICVVPSYLGKIENKYQTQRFYHENIDGVKILRIRVPEFNKSNKKSRIKNIFAYFIGALIATFKVGKMDYVFSISQPPILGGLIGVWGKWVKRAKYIYNIQDFNPEQIIAIGYSNNTFVLNGLMWLDKFSCKRANLVITVGRDLILTLESRFKEEKVPNYVYINNWIDENSIYPLPTNHEKVLLFKKTYGLDGKFVIMYSGNIGLYYDLENILKIIEKFPQGTKTVDGREVAFAFVGSGSIVSQLLTYKEMRHMDNVFFIPYQNKQDLNYSLNAADVHWCVNAKGIKGVSVPSKCYGIMAAAKAMLGVMETGSEAKLIMENAECGLCCEPGDYQAIEKQIVWFIKNAGTNQFLQMGKNGRSYLVNNLTKDRSIKKYIEEILNVSKSINNRQKKAEAKVYE